MGSTWFRMASLAAACLMLSACAVTVDRTDVFAMVGEVIPPATLEGLAAAGGAAEIRFVPVAAAGRSFVAYRAVAPNSCGTWLFFTGNGYGAEPVLRKMLPEVSRLGLDLAVMNYGLKGEEKPTVAAVYEAAVALAEALRADPRDAAKPLYIAGHSLGGWVSLHVAGTVPATGVVIAGTGTNARDVGYALLPGIIGGLVDLKPDADVALLDSPALARGVEEPTLILASGKDPITSLEFSISILQAFPKATPRKSINYVDVDHGAYYRDPQVWRDLAEFFALPRTGACP